MFPFTRTVLVFFIAGLLFIVPRARRTLGAYRIPRETGLLIPGKRCRSRRSEIADANWQADVQLLVGLEVKMEISDKLSLDGPGSKLEQASIIWLVTRG